MKIFRTYRLLLLLALSAQLFALPMQAQGVDSPLLLWEETLQGDEQNPLRWPVAVACASNNEIAVADASNPRLLIFGRTRELETWKVAQSLTLPATPSEVVFDGQRYLVAMRKAGELLVFEGDPAQRSILELPAEVLPEALTITRDGRLYLYDSAGLRILGLARDGTIEREIAGVELVAGMVIEDRGSILAALSYPPAIRRYGANDQVVAEWRVPGVEPEPAWPTGISEGHYGDFVISDRQGGRLVVIDNGGEVLGFGARKGWDPGLLLRPVDVSKCPDQQRIAVADIGNGRVSLFRQFDSDSR